MSGIRDKRVPNSTLAVIIACSLLLSLFTGKSWWLSIGGIVVGLCLILNTWSVGVSAVQSQLGQKRLGGAVLAGAGYLLCAVVLAITVLVLASSLLPTGRARDQLVNLGWPVRVAAGFLAVIILVALSKLFVRTIKDIRNVKR